MAYDREQVTVTLLFDVGGTDEHASTGYSITDPNITGWDAAAHLAALDTTFGDSVAGAYAALMSSPLQWADYSDLVAVKAAALGLDGTYLAEPRVFPISPVESGAVENIAPQLTTVITLWSGLTIGRANYGRLYLPHSRVPLAAGTPRMSTTDQASAVAAAVTFIDALNTIHSGEVPAGLVSNLSAVGTGVTKPVMQVGVGRVLDTQRRRRGQLPEEIAYDPVS